MEWPQPIYIRKKESNSPTVYIYTVMILCVMVALKEETYSHLEFLVHFFMQTGQRTESVFSDLTNPCGVSLGLKTYIDTSTRITIPKNSLQRLFVALPAIVMASAMNGDIYTTKWMNDRG